MSAKTHKTEVVQTRITPVTKMKIMQQVGRGQFENQADFFNTALNLLMEDNSGLFANISRNFDGEYTIDTAEQYQQLKRAYDGLKSAYYALTVLTDNYADTKQPAPNELKDVIRDYLLPRVTKTLKDYEDKKRVSLADRYTEPDDLDDYEM